MGLDRHEQLKLEMQKQYLLGQGLPEGHKGSTCRHQDNPNAMDDGIDDEDLEDIDLPYRYYEYRYWLSFLAAEFSFAA